MNSTDRLASVLVEMYRQNRNPPSTACRIGTVIATSPLKIKWGEKIILTDDQLVIPRLYKEGYPIPYQWQNTKGEMIAEKIIMKVELKKGDQVIIAPDDDLQLFYMIGGI